MKTITYKELMRLGFAKTTARKIIQQVKNIAIKRFEVADKNSINTVKLSKSHSILICPLSSRQVISKNSVCFIRSVVQINVLLTFFMHTTQTCTFQFVYSYRLDDINQAYKDMQDRKTIKSMIVVD